MSPARAHTISGTGQILTGVGTYRGVTIRETTGSGTATVRVHDNTAGSGTLLGTYHLAANASLDVNSDLHVTTGIHVTVTGTIEGSVKVG